MPHPAAAKSGDAGITTSTTASTREVSELFSALQHNTSAGFMRLSASRLRQNTRCYSAMATRSAGQSSTSTTPGISSSGSDTGARPVGRQMGECHPVYSNWVFVASAEVLARAGEGDDAAAAAADGETEEAQLESDAAGAHADEGARDPREKEASVLSTRGGWTKRQYRDEGCRLRGKEWVFR